MSDHGKFEKIEPIGGSEPKRRIQLGPEEDGPSKVKFSEALSKADPSKVQLREQVAISEPSSVEEKRQSLMDLSVARAAESQKVTPTVKSIADQAADIRTQIERPRAVLLANENIPIDPKWTAALTGHIEHVDRGLRDASKLVTGVEVGSTVAADKPAMVKFLSYLTESDKRLSATVEEVNALSNNKDGRLSPEKLLAVQIKLGFVQQELEFFSAVLNKALESTKTVMNVQI